VHRPLGQQPQHRLPRRTPALFRAAPPTPAAAERRETAAEAPARTTRKAREPPGAERPATVPVTMPVRRRTPLRATEYLSCESMSVKHVDLLCVHGPVSYRPRH
jgi:hypothetical protein